MVFLRTRYWIRFILDLISIPFACVGWVFVSIAEGFIDLGRYFVRSEPVCDTDEEAE